MKYKDLMKLAYDLTEDIKHLSSSIANVAILNDLNEMDKKRLIRLHKMGINTSMKALELNKCVIKYITKKHHREELKQ